VPFQSLGLGSGAGLDGRGGSEPEGKVSTSPKASRNNPQKPEKPQKPKTKRASGTGQKTARFPLRLTQKGVWVVFEKFHCLLVYILKDLE
jgi:hypothetical protein